MQIQITVQAPELVGAIEKLANALGVAGQPTTQASVQQVQQPAQQQIQQPTQTVVPTAPVQQQQVPQQTTPQQQAPTQTAVPTTTVQQPVQATPQQQIQQTQVQQPAPQTVPTTATTYTMDQLAVAATQLSDAGKRDELLQILASFGVQALTQLPQEQYPAFAAKLRELGAQI